MSTSFPKAIIHVDGDAFFVGCELASRPWLKGKPVVTGEERGIASALSYEAKAKGVTRGMKISDVRKLCPDVIVLSSDYFLYKMYASRLYKIVERYAVKVEPYSIDECFADITGMDQRLKKSYEEIARDIKNDLDNELGMTFSVGLSVNKVLAKTASKFQKPSGLTFIPKNQIEEYLSKIAPGNIWGIGRNSSIELSRKKIYTALDFISKPKAWVEEFFSKPMLEIYYELKGDFIFNVEAEERGNFQSVMRTQTFRPPSKNRVFLFSELSRHIEEACERLRNFNLLSRSFSFFLKTKDFRYHTASVDLGEASSTPQIFLDEIAKHFDQVFDPKVLYRTAGVRLHSVVSGEVKNLGLFHAENKDEEKSEKFGILYKTVDKLQRKFGENTLFLSSTLGTHKEILTIPKRFNIPSLGVVY